MLGITAPLCAETAGTQWVIDSFSDKIENGFPAGWRPLHFKKIPTHTIYSVERDGFNYFIKAASAGSSSGILKEFNPGELQGGMPFDLKKTPVLRWKWKIDRLIEKSDAAKKSGDDYPARIYVSFKYDSKKASAWQRAKYGAAKKLYGQYPPHAAINYIWDNKLPIGTAVDNAYTDRVKMITVESGAEHTRQWISEQRNVREDYLKAFGDEPPPVAFIAIMTDTDNTGETATAYYDDLLFTEN